MLRDKHNKKNPTQPNPVFPNWVYDRPALIGDFITSPTPQGEPAVPVGELVNLHIHLCSMESEYSPPVRIDVVTVRGQVRCLWGRRNKLWWRICCLCWLESTGETSPLSRCWGGRTDPSSLIQHWTCLSKSWSTEYYRSLRTTRL